MLSPRSCPAVREQFFQVRDRVSRNPREYILEPGIRIDLDSFQSNYMDHHNMLTKLYQILTRVR